MSTVLLAFIESVQHNGRLRIGFDELTEHIPAGTEVQVRCGLTALVVLVVYFSMYCIPPVRLTRAGQLANNAAYYL